VNQPSGFKGNSSLRRCKHHDYAYYDSSWIDESTGKYYNAGYYDENGEYYRGLTVKSGDNCTAEFTCEYCGTFSKYSWNEGAIPNCVNCGAPLTMVDSFAKDEEAPAAVVHDNYNYTGGKLTYVSTIIVVATVAIVVGVMSIVIKTANNARRYQDNYGYEDSYDYIDDSSNIDKFGDDVYLVSNGDGSYSITDSKTDYDKNIFFDYNNHCYYDPDTDGYLWYNTDVSPAIWQYWYEGYSSDYGDYGWMEYDENDGWWVEVSDGEWQHAPASDKMKDFWWIKE